MVDVAVLCVRVENSRNDVRKPALRGAHVVTLALVDQVLSKAADHQPTSRKKSATAAGRTTGLAGNSLVIGRVTATRLARVAPRRVEGGRGVRGSPCSKTVRTRVWQATTKARLAKSKMRRWPQLALAGHRPRPQLISLDLAACALHLCTCPPGALTGRSTMSQANPQARDLALHILVRETLLERSSQLNDRQLIAFLDGWTSALDLLRRTDLVLPGAPPALKQAISTIVEEIRRIQYEVLDERE